MSGSAEQDLLLFMQKTFGQLGDSLHQIRKQMEEDKKASDERIESQSLERIEQLRNRVKENRAKNEQLQLDIGKEMQDKDILQDQCQDIKMENARDKTSIQYEKQQKIDLQIRLENENEKCGSLEVESENLKRENEHLQTNIATIKTENDNYAKDNLDMLNENQSLKNDINDEKTENEVRQTRIDNLITDRNDIETNIFKAAQKAKDLQEIADQQEEQIKQYKEDINDQIIANKDLIIEEGKLRGECAKLKGQYTIQSDQLSDIKYQLDVKKDDNTKLSDKLKTMELPKFQTKTVTIHDDKELYHIQHTYTYFIFKSWSWNHKDVKIVDGHRIYHLEVEFQRPIYYDEQNNIKGFGEWEKTRHEFKNIVQ